MSEGKVYLVGAGPGDPGLITVRGMEILRTADVVVYDRLANPALLAQCRAGAKLIYVGKGPGGIKQAEINDVLVEEARAGHVVCRLKGGDPFLFGRGGEEASYLVANGISFEVVPGVTSAIAVPAYAGIPVTDRRLASVVAMVSGHPAEDGPGSGPRWSELGGADTIVTLMGVGSLPETVAELLAAGRSPDTPSAVIQQGTTAEQRTIVSPLKRIAQEVAAAGIEPPAIMVVGRVVGLREELAWVERKPLWGLRVLVTRPGHQAEALSRALRDAGAEPVEFPCMKISHLAPTEEGLHALDRSYEWILFVSSNGVSSVAAYLRAAGRDWRAMPAGRIGAVGPGTAAALDAASLRVDFMPSRYTVAALASELPGPLDGKAVLLPGRAVVNPRLGEGLAERGAEVTAWGVYEIVTPEPQTPLAEIVGPRLDIVTLTSGSAARGFVQLGGREAVGNAAVACIGPPTAEAAKGLGLRVDVVAEEHTVRGLVEAIVKHRAHEDA
ncbi:MAG: uroporphyrinogen-III C-methyltransferase [Armatimonadota bacterium]|nr:MAG: uroporphyrinogen-III C-methyltransferase [Armatimonadota bacterium]